MQRHETACSAVLANNDSFVGTLSAPGAMDWEVHIERVGGDHWLLNPRYDLANHSPDGFSWGYNGSGPSQLALAMLCMVTSKDIALRAYVQFRMEKIAPMDQTFGFRMTAGEVRAWIDLWSATGGSR